MTWIDVVLIAMRFMVCSGSALIVFVLFMKAVKGVRSRGWGSLGSRVVGEVGSLGFVMVGVFYWLMLQRGYLFYRVSSALFTDWLLLFDAALVLITWGHALRKLREADIVKPLIAALIQESTGFGKGSRFMNSSKRNRVYKVSSWLVDLALHPDAVVGVVLRDGRPVPALINLELEVEGQQICIPLREPLRL